MAKLKRKTSNKRTEEVKINMRRMRERIRRDPERYEEQKRKERERYHKRKQEGKIKSIKELSDREKRIVRKSWRNRSKKYRESKKVMLDLEKDTPPPSPRPEQLNNVDHQVTPCRQAEQGRRIARRNRLELKREIERLNKKLQRSNKRIEKYKKKYYREKEKHQDPNSPTKIVEDLIKNRPQQIKRNLLLGEVVSRQIKDNLKRKQSIKEKHDIVDAISGPLIRKYKFQHVISSVSARISRNNQKQENKRKQKIKRLKHCIKFFFGKG